MAASWLRGAGSSTFSIVSSALESEASGFSKFVRLRAAAEAGRRRRCAGAAPWSCRKGAREEADLVAAFGRARHDHGRSRPAAPAAAAHPCPRRLDDGGRGTANWIEKNERNADDDPEQLAGIAHQLCDIGGALRSASSVSRVGADRCGGRDHRRSIRGHSADRPRCGGRRARGRFPADRRRRAEAVPCQRSIIGAPTMHIDRAGPAPAQRSGARASCPRIGEGKRRGARRKLSATSPFGVVERGAGAARCRFRPARYGAGEARLRSRQWRRSRLRSCQRSRSASCWVAVAIRSCRQQAPAPRCSVHRSNARGGEIRAARRQFAERERTHAAAGCSVPDGDPETAGVSGVSGNWIRLHRGVSIAANSGSYRAELAPQAA